MRTAARARVAGGGNRRGFGGKAQVLEDAAQDSGFGEEHQNPPAAAAVVAQQDIETSVTIVYPDADTP